MAAQRRALLLLLCLGLAAPVAARQPGTRQQIRETPPAAPPYAPPPATTGNQGNPGPRDGPSLEFLEYLGEFETGDGRWHDPISEIEPLDKPLPAARPSQ